MFVFFVEHIAKPEHQGRPLCDAVVPCAVRMNLNKLNQPDFSFRFRIVINNEPDIISRGLR
jgi:hypothetical protein